METLNNDRPELKRFTGHALIGLRRDVKDRHRIVEVVHHLKHLQYDLGMKDDQGDEDYEAKTAIFEELGVARVPLRPSRLADYAIEEMPDVIVERERYVYPLQTLPCGTVTPDPLGHMKVGTKWSGNGIQIAVLDTGYADHRDFDGRQPRPIHDLDGNAVDHDGHGTHCTGLIAGPTDPCDHGDRYGVAYEAEIFNARVLRRRRSTRDTDTDVLSGMYEAWRYGAQILNMSLGTPWRIDEPYSLIFEVVAYLMVEQGILLIAAAGNDSVVVRAPVEHPANCPSIMAVAALNHRYEPAAFSCVTRNDCQKVDVAAPGECIRSTSLSNGYAYETGTSMACAYVSGVAALWAQKTGKRGIKLRRQLEAKCVKVTNGGPIEVGRGLVQAP